MTKQNQSFGVQATTIIGVPATRPPALVPIPMRLRDWPRAPLVRLLWSAAHRYRESGPLIAFLLDIAGDALNVLGQTERELEVARTSNATLQQENEWLRRQLPIESFGEMTKSRGQTTQEIRRIHGGRS